MFGFPLFWGTYPDRGSAIVGLITEVEGVLRNEMTNNIKAETDSTDFPGLAGYRQMKTHFPSARVKKLLQSDEDIGKVAQATPLVVGRAVELFMCALVEKSLQEGSKTHTKKISVAMLNKVIEDNEEFDFVLDVCGKYLGDNNTGNNANNASS